MSGGQLAALIAAGFFAVGMVAAVYVLVRLAGLISAARPLLTDYHSQASALIERANSAVDRADAQLGRTDAITSSMDEVTANMAELSGHVSALSGLARGISAGFGTPLLRVSALAFGVRRALALRTTTQRTAPSRTQHPAEQHRAEQQRGGFRGVVPPEQHHREQQHGERCRGRRRGNESSSDAPAVLGRGWRGARRGRLPEGRGWHARSGRVASPRSPATCGAAWICTWSTIRSWQALIS